MMVASSSRPPTDPLPNRPVSARPGKRGDLKFRRLSLAAACTITVLLLILLASGLTLLKILFSNG